MRMSLAKTAKIAKKNSEILESGLGELGVLARVHAATEFT
jgi:hypothetical protein